MGNQSEDLGAPDEATAEKCGRFFGLASFSSSLKSCFLVNYSGFEFSMFRLGRDELTRPNPLVTLAECSGAEK